MKKLSLASLPCLCLCLGANSSISTGYSFRFGPLSEGVDMPLSMDVDRSWAKDYYAYFEAVFIDQYNSSLLVHNQLVGSGTGTKKIKLSLPGSRLKKGQRVRLKFGICKVRYSSSVGGESLLYNYNEIHTVGDRPFLTFLQSDQMLDSDRVTYYYPRGGTRILSATERLIFQGLSRKRLLLSRKLPLDDLTFTYQNDAYPIDDVTFHAELRFQDHLSYWLGLGEDHSGYVSVPLQAYFASNSDKTQRRYHFRLASSVRYSRIDLSPTKQKGDDTFSSRDLFLPLRQGDDFGMFSYQVVLSSICGNEDLFHLQNSVYSPRDYFGDCFTAEYCVVLGGE